MFNVYVQPHGYDRPYTLFPLLITPSQLPHILSTIFALSCRPRYFTGIGLWATCLLTLSLFSQGYLLSSNFPSVDI